MRAALDQAQISAVVMHSIEAYVQRRQEPGDFLRAVFSNDLAGAVHKADAENLAALPAIVHYCVWEIPSSCWGTPERYRAWLKPAVRS